MRSTLLAVAFAASCAAAPSPQAPANDAEALYRRMEAAVVGAKKLRVDFESATEGSSIKGSLKFEEGNKVEVKAEGAVGAKKYTLEMTCDGAKMNLKRSETPPPPVPLPPFPEFPAPKQLAANVAAGLARGGAWLAQEVAEAEYRAAADRHFTAMERGTPAKPGADLAPEAWHKLGGFRAGKAEGSATPVTYELVRNEEKSVLVTVVTVWIDSKSSLPSKREGAIYSATPEGKKSAAPLSKWTETYQAKTD